MNNFYTLHEIIMANFTPLNEILDMDLHQLRANQGRATDAAIKLFVVKLNEFFSQFGNTKPDLNEKNTFSQIMNSIIAKINEVEMEYFRNKNSTDEAMKHVNLDSYKITFEKLPTRMQFWAATKEFGATIRNPVEHRRAVSYLQTWEKLTASPQPARSIFASSGILNRSNERRLEEDDDAYLGLYQ